MSAEYKGSAWKTWADSIMGLEKEEQPKASSTPAIEGEVSIADEGTDAEIRFYSTGELHDCIAIHIMGMAAMLEKIWHTVGALDQSLDLLDARLDVSQADMDLLQEAGKQMGIIEDAIQDAADAYNEIVNKMKELDHPIAKKRRSEVDKACEAMLDPNSVNRKKEGK